MKQIDKSDILIALAHYCEEGDLKFIETVHNTTFGYKVKLNKKANEPKYEQRVDQTT